MDFVIEGCDFFDLKHFRSEQKAWELEREKEREM